MVLWGALFEPAHVQRSGTLSFWLSHRCNSPSLGTSMTSLAHDKPPLPDVVHADIAGAEKRLRELKGRFKCVSNK